MLPLTCPKISCENPYKAINVIATQIVNGNIFFPLTCKKCNKVNIFTLQELSDSGNLIHINANLYEFHQKFIGRLINTISQEFKDKAQQNSTVITREVMHRLNRKIVITIPKPEQRNNMYSSLYTNIGNGNVKCTTLVLR